MRTDGNVLVIVPSRRAATERKKGPLAVGRPLIDRNLSTRRGACVAHGIWHRERVFTRMMRESGALPAPPAGRSSASPEAGPANGRFAPVDP